MTAVVQEETIEERPFETFKERLTSAAGEWCALFNYWPRPPAMDQRLLELALDLDAMFGGPDCWEPMFDRAGDGWAAVGVQSTKSVRTLSGTVVRLRVFA